MCYNTWDMDERILFIEERRHRIIEEGKHRSLINTIKKIIKYIIRG